MKNKWMKAALYLLTSAVVMSAAAIISAAAAFASVQPPVSGLRIFRDGGTGDSHSVRLMWDAITNAIVTPNDNPDNLSAGNANFERYLRNYVEHRYGAQGYDLAYTNVTRSGAPTIFYERPTPPATTYPFTGLNLDRGSLYAFSVTPYHYHPQNLDGAWSYPGEKIVPQTEQSQAYLLTNIDVNARYENNALTVEWDNPTNGSEQIFPYFRIYIAPQSASDPRANPTYSTIVSAASCTRIPANPLLNRGPMLSYQIREAGDIAAGSYKIAVEPCDSEQKTIRDKAATVNMMIGGIISSLTYSPFQTAYVRQNVSVPFQISVVSTGLQSALLTWGNLSNFGDIRDIAIFASTDKNHLENIKASGVGTPVATIMDNTVNHFPITLQDDVTVYYMLRITLRGTGAPTYSDIVPAIAQSTELTPNSPRIFEVRAFDEEASAIEIFWEPFLRNKAAAGDTFRPAPPSLTLNPDDSVYFDANITYDFWITDDINMLPSSNSGETPVSSVTADILSRDGQPVLWPLDASVKSAFAFNMPVSTYITSTGARVGFAKNKLYYVEARAKKPTNVSSETISYHVSEPSFATIFIPVEGDISSPPMLARPPLTIKNEQSSTSELTVSWRKKWTEAFDYSRDTANGYNPSANSPEWQSTAVKDGSEIFYGEDTLKRPESPVIDFYKITDAGELRSLLGIEAEVPVRALDISANKYEIKIMPFQTFEAAVTEAGGSFQAYLDKIKNETAGWSALSDNDIVTDENDSNELSTVVSVPAVPSSNTTWTVLIRAYNPVTGAVGYANFITATTKPEEMPVVIIPTPPLAVEDKGDDGKQQATSTTVFVKWNNISTYEYEVVYSDVYYTDIENRQPNLSAQYISENSKTSGSGEYRHLSIGGLMPDTEYYFWVRARSGDNVSFYSNSVYLKTAPMQAPRTPRGFGTASSNDLGFINLAEGLNLKPTNSDSIVVQWFKDANDPRVESTGAGADSARVLSHPDLTETYMVMFEGLIPNREYFFRAKTIASVIRGAERATESSYSYLIQMSTDPDFIELKEIYVPAQPPSADNPDIRQAESGWTTRASFFTSVSDDDYDSDADAMTKPLPEQDFEITYNGINGTLTYRFRADEKDTAGNNDNMVDQRLISRLVSQNLHSYDIDVSRYGNSVIHRRVVEVPYSLMEAFRERKISFGIQAGNVKVTLSPETMNTPIAAKALDYGANAKVQIVFAQNPSVRPSLPTARDTFAATPQEVSLFLATPAQYVKMQTLGKPMAVSMSLSSGTQATDSNLGAYVANEGSAGWRKVQATSDKQSGSINFTSNPGIFALIKAQSPAIVSFDQSTPSMINVTSKIAFTDMNVYNGNHGATSNQLLNVMNALIRGESSVAVNQRPEASAVLSMQRAGINISADAPAVSREQAVSAMVRVYEIKTKRQIKPTYTLATTPYADTKSADAAYHGSLLKAAEIDMLNGASALRPKSNLTIGELLELADVVISDAGI